MAYGISKSLKLVASSSQYASIADASQTGLDFSTAFTLEGWFTYASIPSVIDALINKGDSGSNTRGYNFIYQNEATDQLKANLSSNGTIVEQEAVNFPGAPASLDTWIHHALSYNGTAGEVKFFVNGAKVGSTQTTSISSLSNNNKPFAIGALDVGGTPIFFHNGNASLVRAWSIVRTESEIAADMCNVLGPTTGLEGEWTLNDTYEDNSGNGNTLSGSGSPTFESNFPALCATGFTPRVSFIM